MAKKAKNLGKCGILALIVMIITGKIFGFIGLTAAHVLMKHLHDYYLIFIPTIVLAILLGIGLRFGARLGRCSRFTILTFFLVLLFSVACYVSLLFLNDYHDSFAEEPTLLHEGIYFVNDSWNFFAELPFVSDYVEPIEVQEIQNALANIPVISNFVTSSDESSSPAIETPPPQEGAEEEDTEDSPAEETAEMPAVREHIGTQFMAFLSTPLDRAFAQEPVVIGTIFDLVVFVPIQDYLIQPGVTRWEEENGTRQLVFDERAVQPWMLWTAEFLLLWLITLLIIRGGIKQAYVKYQRRLQKKKRPQGLQLRTETSPLDEDESKAKKKKGGLFGRKQETKTPSEEGGAEEKAIAEEEPASEKKKKSRGGWFRRKKQKAAELDETEGALEDLELEFPDEEGELAQLYALILHQYSPGNQDELVQLIQLVGQVSEERARRLLKVPSLIKRDVTTQQANIVIEQFNRAQAQVKLITMEQLLQLQQKQQQTVQPPQQPTPSPQPPVSTAESDEKYALILRKFEPTQRKQVLELLSSLSGTPMTQLQQTLKTPALVLRDASKDEVTMIAQQFRAIQADIKMLSMPELRKLMARK